LEFQPVGFPSPRNVNPSACTRSAMATKPRRKKSPAALQHPIRVVPLHRPEAERVAAASAPQLTYRGGPLLTAIEVFTVFWGTEWNQAPQSVVMKNMNLFFDYILTSQLMDQLGEYSVPGKDIGRGARTGTTVLTSAAAKYGSHYSKKSPPTIFPHPAPTRCTSFFFLPASKCSRVEPLPARTSAAITTPSAATFSTRSCRTPDVPGAPAA
jgi:hypothetical protein